MKGCFGIILLSILFGCSQNKGQAEEFDLCACQVWDEGVRDMSLSEKCIELCLEKFGPQLEGMEEWFAEHCDPQAPKPNTEEHIAQRN